MRVATGAGVLPVLVVAALVAACGDAGVRAPARDRGSARAPVESTTRATTGATAAAKAAAPDRTGAPRILFLGTSLTAGQGLDDPATDAYPAVLQRMADSAGVRAFVVNAGLSGETSAGEVSDTSCNASCM